LLAAPIRSPAWKSLIGDFNAVSARRSDAGRPFLAGENLALMHFPSRFSSFVSAIRAHSNNFYGVQLTGADRGFVMDARILSENSVVKESLASVISTFPQSNQVQRASESYILISC
jgi:hypothetical protein